MLPFAILLTLFMIAVMVFDATRYVIPNKLNLALMALYPALLFLSPESIDWLGGVYAMGAVFVVGFIIFAAGVMGGGDIKLLCVCALFTGWGDASIQFLVYTGILGGVVALICLVGRPLAQWIIGRTLGVERIPRMLQTDEPLPYGLAIAAAFLIILWSGDIPGITIA